MSKRQKNMLLRILISGAFLITALFLPLGGWLRLLIFLVPYGVIGWDRSLEGGAQYSAPGRFLTKIS